MRTRLNPILTAACCVLVLAMCDPAAAEDWPAYRGARGDGIAREKIRTSFAGGAPKRVWLVPTPAGFSSFSVAGGKVFTVIARTNGAVQAEMCVALDPGTGTEIWAAQTGIAKYQGGGDSGAEGNRGGDGPRSTPTVSGGRVFVYSTELFLTCLDANTGKTVWTKDVLKEFAGQNIGWKSALSPLAHEGKVYVAGGGPDQAFLAFDQATGAVLWKSGSEKMTHASPLAASLHGVAQLLFMTQSGVASVEPASGKPLWSFPFPYRTSTACLPVVDGDVVFVTAGYDIGGAACRVEKTGATFEAKSMWFVKGNNALASLWSPPVVKDGYLYGMISFKRFAQGPLKCADLKTGEVKWEKPGFGAGNVVLAGDTLIALADDGQIALVKARPDKYEELARFKALEGKCWSTPALSDGRLYVRSTREGACFELGDAR